MTEGETTSRVLRESVPFWKIWANPIFRRYCRSRLRVKGLGMALIVTLLMAAFVFFLLRAIFLHQMDMEPIDAERPGFIALLILQGLVLFLMGTGQVAGGMTAEADEGVIDYQRLSPMTPLAKVMGYLFGLPVREYVCFLATLPFTLWAIWRGQMDLLVVGGLYLAFMSSAILYHLTGLVAGTVLKNRRWAFLVSMGLVFSLYTVLPSVSNFGLVYFRYITLEPVFFESLPQLIPREAGARMAVAQSILGEARFFNLNFPEVVFTVFSQGFIILTMVMMLWRRWRLADSHLLGKAWATMLFGWIQLTLLGNALPRIDTGQIFPSREFMRGVFQMARRGKGDWKPEPVEALTMAGAVGLVSVAILWVITAMITPTSDTQLRGWRRAKKLGRGSLQASSDPATAFWWVALMCFFGSGGWFLFSRAVIESRWFPGSEMPMVALGAFALVFFAGGLGFQALLEGKGARVAGLAAIFVGVVPIMVGAVLATIDDRFAASSIWIAGISPIIAPIYAAGSVLALGEIPLEIDRAMPRAFWFWQSVAALVMIYLVVKLREVRKGAERSAGGSRVGVCSRVGSRE